jgi:NitT/TauT family transport system substrate-binding protein
MKSDDGIAWVAAAFLVVMATLLSPQAAAETIKIGIIKLAGNGPLYIAKEKGYFAAEGLTAEFMFFTGAEPISSAVLTGDVDVGATGLTAAFYNLAGQGSLRLIAPNINDAAGFPLFATVVSNKAYAAGLKSYRDLPGHSMAIATLGSTTHYALVLIAQKLGFDPASIRMLPLQSTPNIISAVTGGQAESGIVAATSAAPSLQRDDIKLIGFTGDVVAWQTGAMFIATRAANDRRETIMRYLRAVSKGRRDYAAAFIGADGKPTETSTTSDILGLISKYVEQPVQQVKLGISYVDPDGRLDVQDVLSQIAWYKSQGMVKGEFDPKTVIDMRYVVPLPAK